ncbi:non-homologous end joining protein Ku [Paracidovorax citrulli]
MPRTIWKGAISFGLVNIPVALKAAARDNALDFDWLDERDMAPVGYQRINKRTGKVIDKAHIVKGYQYEKGEYVLMSDEDFRQANVEATQTVDIVSFVEAERIPPYYFETPYYLEPDRRGEKGYALLRETLRRTGRAALSLVVIHNRQHLAAVLVMGDALILNTMRWAEEVLPMDELNLPDSGSKRNAVSPREVEMAAKLVEDMQEDWSPEAYHDSYREDLLKRIDKKIAEGQTHLLTPADPDAGEPRRTAEVIDMMSLLRESIKRRGGKAQPADDDARQDGDDESGSEAADEKAPAKKTPARKTSSRSSASARSGSTKKPAAKAARKTSAKGEDSKSGGAKRVTSKTTSGKRSAPAKTPARKSASRPARKAA